jgi:hypothetical protein
MEEAVSLESKPECINRAPGPGLAERLAPAHEPSRRSIGDAKPGLAEATGAEARRQARSVSHSQDSVRPGSDSSRQSVIWREWRNTSDEEYANHLFELVGDEPVDRIASYVSILLGLIYGALIGSLIALLGLLSGLSAWTEIWPIAIGVGTALGAMVGYLFWLLEPQPSWRDWLSRLTFNLSPNGLGLVVLALTTALFGAQIGWMLSWSAGLGHIIGIWALTILLAIGLGIKLVGWMLGLGHDPEPNQLHRYRKLWVWWRRRPLGIEVEAAIQSVCSQPTGAGESWAAALQALARRKTVPEPAGQLVARLRSQNWIDRFAASHILAAAGGAGVAALQPIATRQSSTLRGTAIRLLEGIGQETTARLADCAHKLLCPDCFVRCSSHSIPVADGTSIVYYGCRRCGRSHSFLAGQVVAVLNAGSMSDTVRQQDDSVRINWLALRQPFDFDQVEIEQASDEDIERFAMQVGNDTDAYRQPRYKRMRCLVNASCELSDNTWRILRKTFGELELVNP